MSELRHLGVISFVYSGWRRISRYVECCFVEFLGVLNSSTVSSSVSHVSFHWQVLQLLFVQALIPYHLTVCVPCLLEVLYVRLHFCRCIHVEIERRCAWMRDSSDDPPVHLFSQNMVQHVDFYNLLSFISASMMAFKFVTGSLPYFPRKSTMSSLKVKLFQALSNLSSSFWMVVQKLKSNFLAL